LKAKQSLTAESSVGRLRMLEPKRFQIY
jgi:hypothetical protein